MVDFEDVCGENNSCALSGVASFFMGIEGAVVVVNSPLWCYFNIFKNFSKSSDSSVFCTNLNNENMIYGTEDSLLETLELVKQRYGEEIKILCIENNCSVNLIGDDVSGIAKKSGISGDIICLDSGGAKGDFWEGYKIAAQAYLAKNKFKNQDKLQYSVNLLGYNECLGNFQNDLPEIISLLNLFGIEVNTCIGYKGKNNLEHFAKAELNIVLVESLGLDIAMYCEKNYDMPYLNIGLPYGILGSINWIRKILNFLGIENLFKEKLLDLNNIYNKLCDDRLRKIRNTWGELQFPTVVIGGVSSIVKPLINCVKNEWADCFKIYGLIYDVMPNNDDNVVLINMKNNSDEFKKILSELENGLLLASSNERVLLSKAGVKNVVCKNISTPNFEECNLSGKPFVGFNGNLNLLEEIWNKYIILKKKSLCV